MSSSPLADIGAVVPFPRYEACGAPSREDTNPGPFITLRPCDLPAGHQSDGVPSHRHRAVALLAPQTTASLALREAWNARLETSTDHRNACMTCDAVGRTLCSEGVRLDDLERVAWAAYYERRHGAPVLAGG